MSGFGPQVEVTIARVRADIAKRHADLVKYGLVVWTGGNVSGRVPGADLFVIKPSGVGYDELAPENMILCDLDGNAVAGTPGSEQAPSNDTATHAYVYRNMPEVGGIVHTHSTYASAWAARGQQIPCVIAPMAAEFGGPVPVGPVSTIGDDSIGRGIVETLADHRSRAVLMRNHGPFTIGATARDAVKAAVLLEDVARTVHLATEGGTVEPMLQGEVDGLFSRAQLAGTRSRSAGRAKSAKAAAKSSAKAAATTAKPTKAAKTTKTTHSTTTKATAAATTAAPASTATTPQTGAAASDARQKVADRR